MLRKHGRILIALLVLALIVIVLWLIPTGVESRPTRTDHLTWEGQHLVTGEHVAEYIRGFLKGPCQKRRNKHGRAVCESLVEKQKRWGRAEALGNLIDEVADERHLDPFVVAVVTRHESSFYEKPNLVNEFPNSRGEIGLMQVHGIALKNALRQGYDMKTSEGQLKAGSDHLVLSASLCDGSLYQTLSKYQTGSCRSKAYGPRLRTKKIRKIRSQSLPLLLAGIVPTSPYM